MVEVDKVLLIGEAGVGKSTVARQLASAWALGKWGKDIIALYLAAVCNLQERCYRGQRASYMLETLGTALALECFCGVMVGSKFRRLRSVVERTLDKSSTLVILDGLDESSSSSRYILQEAKYGKHKLLLTSRPYGVRSEWQIANLVVEHKGLSPQQMRSFSSKVLGEKVAPKASSGNFQAAIDNLVHLRQLTCVPVYLRILLLMWQQDSDRLV